MPKTNQTDLRRDFAPLILPWLLGALMLVVYCFTLNRWVTMLNLGTVAQVSGFIWQPQSFNPLMYLVTLPFHWLSPGKIPLALNLFSAVCGSLVLVILARCVALLPQDRTEPQRQREKSDFGFLTGWQSFFPPALAVLMLGLQLAFWEHATSFTGEMFDLLLFATIIWLLLEYRLDEKEWRLTTVALIYGAGITESWMFTAFFPVLLAALIWLKKLEFFSLRFLFRMILSGMVGLLFFFVLPLLTRFDPHFKFGIWDTLRPHIAADWSSVITRGIGASDVRVHLAQASLATILPLLLMAIRWTAGYGDNSRIGTALASNMIHAVHAAVFGVCVWVMFDPPFSPQHLLGPPCLTMNFFCALSIGYCCGYVLLVFGRKPVPSRRDPRPLPVFPRPLMWLCPIIIGCVFVCALFSLAALVYKNKPIIKQVNGDILLKFAQFTTENLPKDGAVILCDSDTPGQDQPLRGLLIQAAIAREGRTRDFAVLDSFSLKWAAYHQIIHEQYPAKFPLIVKAGDRGMVSPLSLFTLISGLARSNTVCYLHPSYGYYFEYFYEEPRGLAYPLKVLPEDTILPPPLTDAQIAENEAFWTKVVTALDAPVQQAVNPAIIPSPHNPIEWFLMHLHPVPEANLDATIAGLLCSRCLNDWGVQLQRAGELDKAARRFTEAMRLNPDNRAADINLAFNQVLKSGAPMEIAPAGINPDQFGKYRNWNAVVTANGPFDDISFCNVAGYSFYQSGYFRQAAKEYVRVHQLAPDNLDARLQLAQIYVLNRLPDRALELLQAPLATPAKFGLNANNSTGPDILAATAHFQKNELVAGCRLLEDEVARHPDDEMLLKATTQAYFMHGLFTNALRVIDIKLARTPDDVTWLFGKGYASIQIGAYEDSIKAMTRVLELQTNDPTARFNRALAYFQSGKLDEARADYAALQVDHTNTFQIAYGLGEIAWRKKENAEALRNYKIYLANAPTNAPEFNTIRERVTQLGGK
ncbi:MAG TPA: tetratricopeptide repeat protein [Candidatus Acidoferrales bacterium]|jgi:tetratricopeptide (TPR) repeat protein|nr:tetratricopeptide repeat protein [Candidatus Acidoferrales bacterium]